jgi:hypothetical protein
MAWEAAAQHYLTDTFAAGHLWTPVTAIRHFWHHRYPQFCRACNIKSPPTRPRRYEKLPDRQEFSLMAFFGLPGLSSRLHPKPSPKSQLGLKWSSWLWLRCVMMTAMFWWTFVSLPSRIWARGSCPVGAVELVFVAVVEWDLRRPSRREYAAIYRTDLQVVPQLVVNDEPFLDYA